VNNILDAFKNSSDKELNFADSFDTEQRRLVHDLVSMYDLKHKSEGEGNHRFIKITKTTDSVETRLVCQASAYLIPESEIVSNILDQPVQTNEEAVPLAIIINSIDSFYY
jgi:hypothetical protein